MGQDLVANWELVVVKRAERLWLLLTKGFRLQATETDPGQFKKSEKFQNLMKN